LLNLGVGARLPDSEIRLARSEARLRERYLDALQRDAQSRLEASIHNARFIDLGIKDNPGAVKRPWGYYNPAQSKHYSSLNEAFRSAKGRLLILGQPGAGKTTALLHIALDLINTARTSTEAPVPLIANSSKFRLADQQNDSNSFLSGRAVRSCRKTSRRMSRIG
jgi:predicted NACHT family NTPase